MLNCQMNTLLCQLIKKVSSLQSPASNGISLIKYTEEQVKLIAIYTTRASRGKTPEAVQVNL